MATELSSFAELKKVAPTSGGPGTQIAAAVREKVERRRNARGAGEGRYTTVPAELLELPSGGHGLNGYKGPMWDAWQKGSLEWLVARKILPP